MDKLHPGQIERFIAPRCEMVAFLGYRPGPWSSSDEMDASDRMTENWVGAPPLTPTQQLSTDYFFG